MFKCMCFLRDYVFKDIERGESERETKYVKRIHICIQNILYIVYCITNASNK